MVNHNWRMVASIPMSIVTGIACLMAITVIFPTITDNIYWTCGIVALMSFASFFGFYWLTTSKNNARGAK